MHLGRKTVDGNVDNYELGDKNCIWHFVYFVHDNEFVILVMLRLLWEGVKSDHLGSLNSPAPLKRNQTKLLFKESFRRQVDRRMVPNVSSPCFSVDKNHQKYKVDCKD